MTGAFQREPVPPGALAYLGGRLGQHSAIYVATAAVTVIASLLSVAVITRFLAPKLYGDLAVLLFFGAMVTTVVNLGSLQGTFAWAFGGGGVDDEVEVAPTDARAAPDRRRAYMTGIALTAAAGTLTVAVVIPLSARLADLLIGQPDRGGLVVLAAVAAACLAVWRLTVNCLRLARRPGAYFAATMFLNAATLGGSVALLAAGWEIEGVLAGQAAGALASVALNLGLARQDVRLALGASDARQILRRGRPLIPVVVSFQTIMLADVFLLSRALPAADVGLYRVASRIGSVVSHLSSAFLMAWGALRRDPLHHAADAGESGRADAALTTYFTVFVASGVLAVGVLADALVLIAGPDYPGAAPLIPLTALAFAFHGWYVVTYRTARFPTKRPWFIGLSVVVAIVFVGGTLLLLPVLDAYAAPAAAVAAWIVGIIVLAVRSRGAGASVPLASPRVLLAVLLAAACYGLDQAIVDASSPVGSLKGLWVLALYPLLLAALGVISRSDMRSGVGVARSYLPVRHRQATLRKALESLDPLDRVLLVRCVTDRRRRDDVAAELGITAEDVARRFVAVLRRLGGLGQSRDFDDRVAAYLLSDRPFAERDEEGRRLVAEGLDALELDELRRLVGRVARAMRSVGQAPVIADGLSRRP